MHIRFQAFNFVFQGLESNPAKEQGFHGEKVRHKNMDTMAGDWRREFGPNGPRMYVKTPRSNKF